MTFLFSIVAVGCQNDTTFRRPIEITGYLDPGRIELTARTQVDAEETVTGAVAGRPGATDGAAPIHVRNQRSDEEIDVDPASDGAFWAAVDVLDGDEIEISQDGAEAIDLAVEPLEHVPEWESLVAHLSDDHERVVVTVTFFEPLNEGWILAVANPPLSLVSELARSGETGFEGQIEGNADSTLELYGRNADGQPTLSYGIEVPND
jgi:hypothetical protein